MILNEATPALRTVKARLYDTSGAPLPSGHAFAIGDLKIVQPDGTVANATNLPSAVVGAATGTFDIVVAQSELQQPGDIRLQLSGSGVAYWEWVEPVETPDARLNNLDAAISTRARPSDVPSATTIAAQVDTTLTAAHGGGTWQQGNTTVPPTAAAIATMVWQIARSGNQPAGSFGEYIDAHISAAGGGSGGEPVDTAAFAAAVWDMLRAGHQAPGSFGEYIDAAISAAGGSGGGGTVDSNAVAAAVVAALLPRTPSSPPITRVPIYYNVGDLEPPLLLQVPFDGVNDTLDTATTVQLRWKKPDNSVTLVPLTTRDPNLRVVQRTWSAGDTAQAGVHTGEVVITWEGGRTSTVQTLYQWTVKAQLA